MPNKRLDTDGQICYTKGLSPADYGLRARYFHYNTVGVCLSRVISRGSGMILALIEFMIIGIY